MRKALILSSVVWLSGACGPDLVSAGTDSEGTLEPCEERRFVGDYGIEQLADPDLVSSVTHIDGSVSLLEASVAGELELNCLETISGQLLLQEVVGVEAFRFPRLREVQGDVAVLMNQELVELELPALQRAASLDVFGNPALEVMADMQIVEPLENLSFHGNPLMKDLPRLGSVREAKFLIIIDMESLTNLRGLESLDTVGHNVRIVDNELLESLDGLSGLKTVGFEAGDGPDPFQGSLSIEYNAKLTSVAGIHPYIDGSLVGVWYALDVRFNPSLPVCRAISLTSSVEAMLADAGGNLDCPSKECFAGECVEGIRSRSRPNAKVNGRENARAGK